MTRHIWLAIGPRAPPRRVLAARVPVHRVHGRLVERDPVLDAVAEASEAKRRILDEGARGRLRKPAVVLDLQHERQIPVVERDHRVDSVRYQLVNQHRVEAHALLVHRAIAIGQHARPRDREAVVAQSHLRHQLHIGAPAVVVIGGHVARLARFDLSRRVGKGVPDGETTPAFLPTAFDLVRGSRRAEGECRRE